MKLHTIDGTREDTYQMSSLQVYLHSEDDNPDMVAEFRPYAVARVKVVTLLGGIELFSRVVSHVVEQDALEPELAFVPGGTLSIKEEVVGRLLALLMDVGVIPPDATPI